MKQAYFKHNTNWLENKTKVVKSFMLLAVVPDPSGATGSNSPLSYLIGGIITLLIMGYLIYTLLRPEKF